MAVMIFFVVRGPSYKRGAQAPPVEDASVPVTPGATQILTIDSVVQLMSRTKTCAVSGFSGSRRALSAAADRDRHAARYPPLRDGDPAADALRAG